MKSRWILIGGLLAATASAQMDMGSGAAATPFAQAMKTGMDRMDRDMAAAPMNGNPDHDFVTMMIPHHQGAIDMAKGELEYGKDPEMRHLAQQIVADQQAEIDLMNVWLKKNAAPQP